MMKSALVAVFLVIIFSTTYLVGRSDASSVRYEPAPPPLQGNSVGHILLDICDNTTNGRILHVQTHKNARLEISCEENQYRMKIVMNGRTIYVGKCPFPLGHNVIQKVISGNPPPFNTTALPDRDLKYTIWKSFNATQPGVNGVQRNDIEWTFVARTMQLYRQNTTHTSNWQNGSYQPQGTGYDGDPKRIDPLPTTPQDLGFNALLRNTSMETISDFAVSKSFFDPNRLISFEEQEPQNEPKNPTIEETATLAIAFVVIAVNIAVGINSIRFAKLH